MESKPSDNRVPTPEISNIQPSSPTLDPAHQHHDAHHINRQSIEKITGDGTVYTKEIAYDGSNGRSDDGDSREKPGDEKAAVAPGGDEEAGATSGKSRWLRRYRKQIRIAIHAVIWLLFTG